MDKTVKLNRSDSPLTLEFTGRYTPATPEHFCNGHGNWLPGDAAEFDVEETRLGGMLVTGRIEAILIEEFYNEILEECLK
jgi:hypothetical protein